MCVRINFTVSCPLCGNMEVPIDKAKGLIINRKLSLASDIISERVRIKRFDPKKEAIALSLAKENLADIEQELLELGGEIPKG